ncbi:hypothetical protein ACIRU3_46230 [Streptomyces sp. NPDC101151]|uniref:hypothetical protein n=1 Tax=Streptomyces sp. NPDC101151 TaxID=3366115 RepID=UPI0038198BB3
MDADMRVPVRPCTQGVQRPAHRLVDSRAALTRWARIVAHATPLIVLPSGIWRIATVLFNVAGAGLHHGAADSTAGLPDPVYVTLLSVFSEFLAFTAIGLIVAWGDVFPRWVPLLRGRRVPNQAAVIPAALCATVLTVLWTTLAVQIACGTTLRGSPLRMTPPPSRCTAGASASSSPPTPRSWDRSSCAFWPADAGGRQPTTPVSVPESACVQGEDGAMNTPEENDTAPADKETRERSAEQRNIPVPTPKDVRAKAAGVDDGEGEGDDDADENEPPAADTQAP